MFLEAIESVLDGLERARVHEGGMLVSGSIRRGGRRAYDVSLAIAYELTGQRRYLDAAGHFAGRGVQLFLGDGRPLPKASHVHDHYEAVTNGDTLMMALLRLWEIENQPRRKLRLVFTDR